MRTVKVKVTQSCPTLCNPMDYTEFSEPEYWSGQPFPSPGDLPDPGIKHRSPTLQADSLPSEPTRKLKPKLKTKQNKQTNKKPPELPQWLHGKESACNARDLCLIPGSGKSPANGNGSPLQYSYPENPMDRAAWQATVRGVAKSQMQITLSLFMKSFQRVVTKVFKTMK